MFQKAGLVGSLWWLHILFCLAIGGMVHDLFAGGNLTQEAGEEPTKPARVPCYYCNNGGAGSSSPGVGMEDGDPLEYMPCTACDGSGWVDP